MVKVTVVQVCFGEVRLVRREFRCMPRFGDDPMLLQKPPGTLPIRKHKLSSTPGTGQAITKFFDRKEEQVTDIIFPIVWQQSWSCLAFSGTPTTAAEQKQTSCPPTNLLNSSYRTQSTRRTCYLCKGHSNHKCCTSSQHLCSCTCHNCRLIIDKQCKS